MERNSGKILIAIGLFFISMIAFSAGYIVRDQDIEECICLETECGIEETYHTFFEVLDMLEENHFSQPSKEELIEGAIEGMINSLDDPYTSYFDYEAAAAFADKFGEVYVGVGISVRYENNMLIIEDVFENSPAQEAGLRVNDVITHVNGENVTKLSLYQIIPKIIGEEGTDVTIGVYRSGFSDTLYFLVTRAVIEHPTVTYTTFEKNGQTIGYIEVSTFGDETYNKFIEAIADLEETGIDGMIIDLRDNGGGHLFTVFYMMQQFLIDDGNPIFSTEHYSNGLLQTTNYASSTDDKKPYDIVTLVNGNSASASEVFASGMQEHGDYILVGETTFGKGTMQTDKIIETTLQDELHITIGKWFTADGNWVHYEGGTDGITPDIIVSPSAAETAYKVFLIDEDALVFDTVDTRIANVQIVLNALGYNVRTDGYFDSVTMDAVLDIQTAYGLTINGQLNSETLEIINDLLHVYQNDPTNDSQLQAALDYLTNND